MRDDAWWREWRREVWNFTLTYVPPDKRNEWLQDWQAQFPNCSKETQETMIALVEDMIKRSNRDKR